jgi:hypothetical protein
MCLFSKPVRAVAEIRMFARSGKGGRQFLACDFRIDASEPCALLIPLPVPPKTIPSDVRFLNFENYPQFFADVESGFPSPPIKPRPPGMLDAPSALQANDLPLTGFEAEYVPDIPGFAEVGAPYRLSQDLQEQLPQYNKSGFAVIKIQPGKQQLRPIVFDFPRRDPKQLFFPTLQVLDGRFHETEVFDHALYSQPSANNENAKLKEWYESRRPADFYIRTTKTQDVVDADAHVYVRRMIGKLKNVDVIL